MAREKANQRYKGYFKQEVVEHMRDNKLGLNETMRIFGITSKSCIPKCERIYREEGAAGLYLEFGEGDKVAPCQNYLYRFCRLVVL